MKRALLWIEAIFLGLASLLAIGAGMWSLIKPPP